MTTSQIYLAISLGVLCIIAVLVLFLNKNRPSKPLTPLASLAFGFVIAGIIFGEDRRIGYSLLGIGVILSVIDMVRKLRK